MFVKFVVLLVLFDICCSYKLLVVFPFPGKSHSILGEGYVRHLINAGHEVTYLTAIPSKISSPKLRHVMVETNFEYFREDEMMDISKMLTKDVDIADLKLIFTMLHELSNATVSHSNVQALMNNLDESFDAVIAEWMFNELYAGIAAVFNCPLIWSSSVNPHHIALAIIDEAPNPAYTADLIQSNAVPPFTFWKRCWELWIQIYANLIQWQLSAEDEQAYRQAFSSVFARRGGSLPPYEDVKYNGSIMLGNSHPSTGDAIRLPQNHINIGGYHIDENVKPLPKELQTIMDNAKHGVIYFSMGSMLKSRTMPDTLKREMLKMFGELKQDVIWKFEELLSDLPSNVHIVQWAPQPSILAHKNCILFITHGGLLSTTEAVHFGVPIIGIPMFADQALNVNRAESKGFAKRVKLDYDTPNTLRTAIKEVLGNPKYKRRIKELSLVYHDRPVSPGAELVHWVEHVVKTRGAPHLRSPALMVPWYQKHYLDLLVVIILLITSVIYFIRWTFVSKKIINYKKIN